jgi:UDP-N-acetylmuramate: L-alanyl-gamma-D-glutamyl-meso-diaminopimelate ligase
VHVLARPELRWDAQATLASLGPRLHVAPAVDALLAGLLATAHPGDHVVFMSNGGFEGASRRFLGALAERAG